MTSRDMRDMNLNSLREWVGNAMSEKGFHDGRSMCGRDDTLVRLCLIHTEVSEAVQVVKRHGVEPDQHASRAMFEEEVADIFIRLFDLCWCVGVDIEVAVVAKMAKNMARPHKYGTPDEAKVSG